MFKKRLSSYIDWFEAKESSIKKDADFKSLGQLNSSKPYLFTYLNNVKFLDLVNSNNNISCICTTSELSALIPKNMGIVVSPDPQITFFEFFNELTKPGADLCRSSSPSHIAKSAFIHPSAIVSQENVFIEEDVVIEPYAVIKPNTRIKRGCNVVLQVYQIGKFL